MYSRSMLRIWLLLLAFACLQAAHGAAAPPPTIVVFGDSISAAYGLKVEEGWVALLQKKLTAQGYGYRIVNASVSGETSGGGLSRLPRTLELHRPQILILELGANDGLRGLPLAEVRANLQRMIERARKSGARVVLLGMRMPPNYGPQYTQAFQAMYADVARQFDLPLVPFLLDGIALHDSLMQQDGLHPNAAAQPRIVETVWRKIEPLLKR
jgi:acyl-CoA thioesterase-1